MEELEEHARILRIAALRAWDEGEIEESEIMRATAQRIERKIRESLVCVSG